MAAVAFDQFEIGQVYRSTARTLTEADHGLFMMLVGDWHPIHADAEFAKKGPFGRRLMHGSFGVALTLGMQTWALEFADQIVGALGLKEWQFMQPLFIGDTVHVEVEICGKRVTSSGDRAIVQRRLRLIKHDRTVVQEGLSDVMLQIGRRTASD